MTSARSNVIDFTQRRVARRYEQLADQPLDYEQRARFVHPIAGEQIARFMGDPDELIDLYRSREEQERIDRIIADISADDARVRRLQKRVAWACIAAAYFAIIYFAFCFGRAM